VRFSSTFAPTRRHLRDVAAGEPDRAGAGFATPSGPIRAVLPPPVNKDWTFPMGDIPALGAHTTSILTELGRTPDDLAALHADGVI
jgi:crotonobetainyl-CoA:carnitine CoA-transferase CaiB-like acyl-CoA transferase